MRNVRHAIAHKHAPWKYPHADRHPAGNMVVGTHPNSALLRGRVGGHFKRMIEYARRSHAVRQIPVDRPVAMFDVGALSPQILPLAKESVTLGPYHVEGLCFWILVGHLSSVTQTKVA
jgi:hypothetical protein